jgi:hypothetical protein
MEGTSLAGNLIPGQRSRTGPFMRSSDRMMAAYGWDWAVALVSFESIVDRSSVIRWLLTRQSV